MSTLLSLETSGRLCSVAIWHGGEVVAHRSPDVEGRHSEHVLPTIQATLSDAQLKLPDVAAFAFGDGPGSFSGVRSACTTVQALALASNKPVIPIGTLAGLAIQAGDGEGWAAVDARMGEVYAARYHAQADRIEVLYAPATLSPAAFKSLLLRDPANAWIGNAWHCVAELSDLGAPVKLIHCEPNALGIARLASVAFARGETIAAREAKPRYVRDQVALTEAERAQARLFASSV